MEDIKKYFRVIGEFADLDEGSLELLASGATIEQFAEGKLILEQGVKGVDVWLIIEGSVNVVQKTHSGKQVELATLGPTQIFGEISVLTEGLTTAEVVAAENCRAIRIPGENLSKLTKGNLTTMARFAKSVVYRLSDSSRKR